MYGSRVKKIHESYMHGSFLRRFLLRISVITASLMLVTVLNISIKKTQ